MQGVSIPTAFLGGIITFLSPCILPLIPVYLSILSGISVSQLRSGDISGKARLRVLLHTLIFILGFTIVFNLFGILSASVGGLSAGVKTWLVRIGGVLVIILGLHTVHIITIPFLNYEVKPDIEVKRGSLWGSFLIGTMFGVGWTPCVGPILAAITFMSVNEGKILSGIILFSAYSLGLALPFIITSVLADTIIKAMAKYKKIPLVIEKISGVLLIAIGVVMLFGNLWNYINAVANKMVEWFPFLGSIE